MPIHSVGTQTVRLPEAGGYALHDTSRLLTPALLVYPDFVEANLRTIARLLDNDLSRWRAHVKSAKLASVMGQVVRAGVTHLKCATTLELRVACEVGASDVLVAYPTVGPKVARVRQLAADHPGVNVSVLVESAEAVADWRGSNVGLFVDVNPGMDRTGVPDSAPDAIAATARAIADAGLRFGGLHYYDGHLSSPGAPDAEALAHAGYERLLGLVERLDRSGVAVPEIITAGTPALPFSLSFPPFGFAGHARDPRLSATVHRVSPGTLVYCDATSPAQLPADWDLRPAAIVATTVVSHPAPGRVTCDAGHKTVSADAGVPTCAVLGRPDLQPLKPSEEHLPLAVAPDAPVPAIGEVLYLVPRHVCPTVNNFDQAALVRDGRIERLEAVTARGREAPLAR